MKIKWLTLPKSDGNSLYAQHAFKPTIQSVHSEEKEGNLSLCGKVFSSENGEYAQSFESLMESKEINHRTVCKLCYRAFRKIEQNNKS
jgi:hypothetical protein